MRKLTKEQQQYAREIFTELLDVRGMIQQEVADELRRDRRVGTCNQTTVSRGKNSGLVSMQVLLAAAKLAGRSPEEVKQKTEFDLGPSSAMPRQDDPKFGTFFLRLGELPGLRAWLNENPQAATIGEVWCGIQAYEKTPTLSRANDGQPTRGWESFFADLRAGRIGSPTSDGGDAAAVLRLEREERPNLPSTTTPPKRSGATRGSKDRNRKSREKEA